MINKDQKGCNLYTQNCYDLIKEWLRLKNIESQLITELKETNDDSLWKKMDAIRYLIDSIDCNRNRAEMKILKENPKDNFSTFLLSNLLAERFFNYKFKYSDDVIKLSSKISRKERGTYEGRLISQYLSYPFIRIGQKVADSEFQDSDGNIHRLTDYKGKPLILHFGIREAEPKLKNLLDKYNDKIRIVYIRRDFERQDRVEDSKIPNNLGYVNRKDLKGNDTIFDIYDVRGYPQFFLISSEGIILETWIGYQKGITEDKIEKVLQENL